MSGFTYRHNANSIYLCIDNICLLWHFSLTLAAVTLRGHPWEHSSTRDWLREQVVLLSEFSTRHFQISYIFIFSKCQNKKRGWRWRGEFFTMDKAYRTPVFCVAQQHCGRSRLLALVCCCSSQTTYWRQTFHATDRRTDKEGQHHCVKLLLCGGCLRTYYGLNIWDALHMASVSWCLVLTSEIYVHRWKYQAFNFLCTLWLFDVHICTALHIQCKKPCFLA